MFFSHCKIMKIFSRKLITPNLPGPRETLHFQTLLASQLPENPLKSFPPPPPGGGVIYGFKLAKAFIAWMCKEVVLFAFHIIRLNCANTDLTSEFRNIQS